MNKIVISINILVIAAKLLILAPVCQARVPDQLEVEHALSQYYQKLGLETLSPLLPGRQFSVLVDVKLDSGVNLNELENSEDSVLKTLPGMPNRPLKDLREDLKDYVKLSHSKHFLVVAPLDTKASVKNLAEKWLRKLIPLTSSDEIDFEFRESLIKEPPKEVQESREKPQELPKKLEEPPKKAEEPKNEDKSNSLEWIGVLILILVLALLVIAFLALRKKSEDKKTNDTAKGQDPLPPKQSGAIANQVTQSESEKVLAKIDAVCSLDSELSSQAFSELISHSHELDRWAAVVQYIGIENAVRYFPSLDGNSWSILGEALSLLSPEDEPSPEDLQAFHLKMTGGIARALQRKNEENLLPKLSNRQPTEIARKVQSLGFKESALALLALPKSQLPSVIKSLGKKRIPGILESMVGTRSAKRSDLKLIDDADVVGSEEQSSLEFDPEEVLASVLSCLSAEEEFSIFNNLVSRKRNLLQDILPYRVLPGHLNGIPDRILGVEIQNFELAEAKSIISGVDPSLRDRLLSFLSEKQRLVIESSLNDSIESGPDSLRKFLSNIYTNHVKSSYKIREEIVLQLAKNLG